MTENTENTEETEETAPLLWLVNKGGVTIRAPSSTPGEVRILLQVDEEVSLPIEDARELLTHALAHMGGSIARADTSVAEVAIELCAQHANMREQAEKRLAALQEKHALQARHLGEYMGRLKKYENKD